MTLVAHPRHGTAAELRLVPHEFPEHSLFQLPFPSATFAQLQVGALGRTQPSATGSGAGRWDSRSHDGFSSAEQFCAWPEPLGSLEPLLRMVPPRSELSNLVFHSCPSALPFSQLHASSAAWLLQNPAHLRSPPLVPCVAVSQTSELLQALQKPETRACSCYPDFPSCFPRAGPKHSALPELEGSQSVSG